MKEVASKNRFVINWHESHLSINYLLEKKSTGKRCLASGCVTQFNSMCLSNLEIFPSKKGTTTSSGRPCMHSTHLICRWGTTNMAKSHTRGALMPPSKQGLLQNHPIIPSQSICVKKKQEMSGIYCLNFSNTSGTHRFLLIFLVLFGYQTSRPNTATELISPLAAASAMPRPHVKLLETLQGK